MNLGEISVCSAISACVAISLLALFAVQPVHGFQQAQASAPRSASAGVYSADQAVRGQTVYVAQCSQCHGEGLSGTEFGPALIGNTFATDFDGASLGDLVERIRTTMPQNNPGALSPAETLDVIAYVLKNNDFPAGKEGLSPDPAALTAIKIDAKKPALRDENRTRLE